MRFSNHLQTIPLLLAGAALSFSALAAESTLSEAKPDLEIGKELAKELYEKIQRAHKEEESLAQSEGSSTEPLPEPVESVTLSNGILVEHFILGTGKSPIARDKVSVHYLGRLADGSTFDSSYDRGEESTFYLNKVIKCWTQGLQEMKEGGYARIGCPDHTAYGSQGVPGVIPPDSVLFFDVELLKVN